MQRNIKSSPVKQSPVIEAPSLAVTKMIKMYNEAIQNTKFLAPQIYVYFDIIYIYISI